MELTSDIVSVLEKYKPLIKEAIIKYVPKKFTTENFHTICGKSMFEDDLESLNSAIIDPIWDILSRGGKNWRGGLLLLVCDALGGEIEQVVDLCCICEVVHNGTLVIDDIEDNSLQRRGKPCLHLLIGNDLAINAGNAMYFLPLTVLEKRKDIPDKVRLKCYDLYTREMVRVHLGQGLDIWWHQGKHVNPTCGQYLQMCGWKTGALARMSAMMSALICGVEDSVAEAIGNFAVAIGVAFQIQDDILNVAGDSGVAAGKGQTGEDIREGKRTLMVIHSMEHSPPETSKRLLEILDKHTEDQKEVDEAIQILNQSKSIEYSKQFAKGMIEDAWKAVEHHFKEGEAKSALRSFATFLITRST